MVCQWLSTIKRLCTKHCQLYTWWHLITAACPTSSIVLTSCMEYHCKNGRNSFWLMTDDGIY